MTQTYYIDGYNVLHKLAEIDPLHADNLETARDTLIEHVAGFCSTTGNRATIVFDGRGRTIDSESHPVPGLTVMYSPERSSADAVIEKAVANTPDRKTLVIVTGDHGIADLCRGMGALVIPPETFFSSLVDASQRTSARVRASQRGGRIGNLEEGLDPDTRSRLAALRKKLDEK